MKFYKYAHWHFAMLFITGVGVVNGIVNLTLPTPVRGFLVFLCGFAFIVNMSQLMQNHFCSRCKIRIGRKEAKFCPACGAKILLDTLGGYR